MKQLYALIMMLFLSFTSNSQTFNGGSGPLSDSSCDATHDFPVTVSGVSGIPIVVSEIKFDISHTYDADLYIYLVAPNGTVIELSTGNGGGGDNYTNTTISRGATQNISAGTAPFSGVYAPEGDLSVLNGVNYNGTWILRVCDQAGSDVGILNSWSLTFGSIAVSIADSVNLLSPYSASFAQSNSVDVYGQIYKSGLTDATTGQTPGIQAWVGYNTTNTNPNSWTNWIPATFNQKVAGKDEYKATIGTTLTPGTYYYATRFRINGEFYFYGGTNDDFWDGATHNSGVLTVTQPSTPLNDNCSGAFPLTVNSDYLCGAVTHGTVLAATASLVDGNSCFGSEDDDVWFSFVATASSHRISLLNRVGSDTNLVHSLWTGSDCNTLTIVPGSCSDPETSNPTGLVLGRTYYLRVNTPTPNPFQTTVFDVCIGTGVTAPDYVTLHSPSSATITSGASFQVLGRILKTGLTDIAPGQTPGIQVWVGSSPNNTNPSTWTNWDVASFNQKVGGSDEYKLDFGSDLSPGTYYYAMRFLETGGSFYYGGIDSGNNGGFWDGTTFLSGVLTVGQPLVPVNDDCLGAIPLTVGNIFSDNPVQGSFYGATDTTPTLINCDGIGKMVHSSLYYTVTVPPSGAVTIETKASSSNSMSDTIMVVSLGSCSSLIGMACNDNNETNFAKLSMFGQSPGSTLYVTAYSPSNGGMHPAISRFQIAAYTAVLGIDDFDSSKFSYYPNPVKDFMTLSYDKEISNVEVFNLLGQKVSATKIDATEVRIDMSNLPKGMYLVNVTSDKQMKTIKVVKE